MANKLNLSNANITTALRATNGQVYLAAAMLGCDHSTLYRRIKKSEALQAVIDESRGMLIDEAENALRSAVKQGEAWAVIWTLKTIGKARGYVERQEVTAADGAPLDLSIRFVQMPKRDELPPGELP